MIILGSTGSIGTQALQIARAEHLAIEVLCAGDNIDLLNAQIAEFRPKIAVIKDSTKRHLVKGVGKVLCGELGILEAIREAKSNFVLNALVGFSGVGASLEAMRLGKTLALANKESLVVAGFLMDGAEVGKIIPVDSEHFALKELIDSALCNLSWGMRFRTCENFWDSADYQSSVRPKNFHKYKSHTAITSIVDSAESAESSEKIKCEAPKKSFCYFWLLPKVESSLSYQSQTTKQGNFVESILDSTKSQNFAKRIKKLLITASGGAFRDFPLNEIPKQNAKSALKHPTWAMGRKITIDSATMINKLFEILEAKWLFGVENIDAVIERSSTIHALIQTSDNAIMAHLSTNDMRLPIARAILGAKARQKSFIKELDLMSLCIKFEPIDTNRYPLWQLKDEVLKRPKLGAIINAANDILVAKFLKDEICFGDISHGIFAVVDKFGAESIKNIDEILELNKKIADFLSRFKGFSH